MHIDCITSGISTEDKHSNAMAARKWSWQGAVNQPLAVVSENGKSLPDMATMVLDLSEPKSGGIYSCRREYGGSRIESGGGREKLRSCEGKSARRGKGGQHVKLKESRRSCYVAATNSFRWKNP